MPLREALQPDTPLQPAEQAELIISKQEPASRTGSAVELDSADFRDSGRLDEVANPLLASGPGSPSWVEPAAMVRAAALPIYMNYRFHAVVSRTYAALQGRSCYDINHGWTYAYRKPTAALRSGSWSLSPAPAALPR